MYSYKEAMKHDIKEWMDEHKDEFEGMEREEVETYISDACWVDDSVTGNASGSYTFNRALARSYFFEDVFSDDYLAEAIREFDIPSNEIADRLESSDWEWIDCTIRCYLLNWAVSEVLDEQ